MQQRQPSRTLNDDSVLMGLGFGDLMAATLVLLFSHAILSVVHYSGAAILIAIAYTLCLIPIRQKHRKKIISDFIDFHLSSRVVNVSKRLRTQNN
jgi:hypothetical protein